MVMHSKQPQSLSTPNLRPIVRAEFARQLTQQQLVFGVAIVLILVFSVSLPGFFSTGNLIAILSNISIVGLLALGSAIVILARGLDISQIGSMVGGAAIAAILLNHGWPLSIALLAGFVATTIVGVFNGWVIAYVEVPALFATLASNLLVAGAVRLIVGSTYLVQVPESATQFLAFGGKVIGIPIAVIVFIAMAILIHLFLRYTRLGHFIYAHGDNPDTARLTGISVRLLTIFEYVVCADIGYLAGLLLMAQLATVDTQMITGSMIFDVILIAVLGGVSLVGGRGSVFCVLAGALLVGVVLNAMTLLNLSNDMQNIVRGLILLVAIVLDNRLHPRNEETARQGE